MKDNFIAVLVFISELRNKMKLEQEHYEALEEALLLDKIEAALKELVSKYDKNVDISSELNELMDHIEAYAQETGKDISELDPELNDLYHDAKELEAGDHLAKPSPYQTA